LHGGRLQIESTPDKGTTVLAWLPATEPDGAMASM
jgi:signal transduction histidine kinase